MRLCALVLGLVPLAAGADEIVTPSRVEAVTLYPRGATIVRHADFSAPPGVHEVIVPDFPAAAGMRGLRVTGGAGFSIGALSVQQDRLPPRDPALTARQQAARAEVERLEDALREGDDEIARLRLGQEAAEAQAAFLRAVAAAGAEEKLAATTPDALRAYARMIGEEMLAARQAGLAAAQAAEAAGRELADTRKALKQARQVLESLMLPPEETAALSVAVEVGAAPVAGRLVISYVTDAAGWAPVYDLRLTRTPAPALVLERGGVVQQWTGEAWSGVALTLSNARPAERRAPGELWPDLRRIVPPMAPMPAAPRAKVAAESDAAAGYAPPVAEPSVIVADTGHDGPTVIYRYPRPVDLASDVEGVRLALDELALLPEISARAVPRLDDTAFLIARARNDTGQVLLPGTAALFLDGAWIGDADLPLTPEAGEVELAFGAIDGLRLSRRVPERETGDRGVLSRSNRHDETAVIEVRNLTPEPWQVRVLDSVPYSEQEDLRIDWRAEPAPDETDVDGARGILAWDLRLPAGGTGTIRIGHSIAWPEGMVLQ